MTNEKRVTMLYEMLRAYDQATGENKSNDVINEPHAYLGLEEIYPFYSRAAQMIIEAMEKLDTKNACKASLPAIKRLMKNGPEKFQVMFTSPCDGEDRYTIAGRCLILRFNEDFPSLPHTDNPPVLPQNVPKLFEGVGRDEEMPLPSVADLKAYKARCKAEGKEKGFPVEVGGVWYNPDYLIDIQQALPGCRMFKPLKPVHPTYFEAENGDAILLPVKR